MLMLAALRPPASAPTVFGADLTSTSFAIAGSADSSYPSSRAFDDDASTNWFCAGGVTASNAWVGQDFGSGNAKTIRKLTLRNSTNGGGSSTFWYDHVKLQYSDDGSSWSDALEWYSADASLTKTQDSTTVDSYIFQAHGAHRWWRVLGIDGASSAYGSPVYGCIGEIEMMEAA